MHSLRLSAMALCLSAAFCVSAGAIAAPAQQATAPAVVQASADYLQSIRWDAEYDVVVAGYGFAGAAAAVAAADAGAKVLLVEKAPYGKEGGNSRYAHQGCLFFEPDAPDDKLFAYMKAMQAGASNPSDDVIRTYIRETKDQVNYLKRLGAKDPKVTPNAAEFPDFEGAEHIKRVFVSLPGGDGKLYALMQENVEKRADRIDVWYDSPAVKLLQDPKTGIVHGMVVKSEGVERFIRAKNGVVLATGGFENNPKMYENYAYIYNAFPKGAHFNTGDGIEMALDVNAKLVNMAVVNGPDPNVINPETGAAYAYLLHDVSHSISGCGFTRNNVIMVGADGWRFMNEATHSKHGRVPYHKGWTPLVMPDESFMIFDDAARRSECIYESWSKDSEKEIASGMVKKSDTIEGLARELGIDPAGLKEQVEFYNQQCREGEDKQFQRAKKYLKPIETGPFYGVKVEKTFTNTQGGPQRNERAELINRSGGTIAHLYGAGELGSIFPNLYNGGGNIAESLVFGRIAGAQAAIAKTDVDQKSVMNGRKAWAPKKIETAKTESDEVVGKSRGIGGSIVLGVKVKDGAIKAVRVLEQHETPGIGAAALEHLPADAVAKNGEVDIVSGATITSKGFNAALKDALSKAK